MIVRSEKRMDRQRRCVEEGGGGGGLGVRLDRGRVAAKRW